MNKVLDILKQHRSIRKFTDQAIDESLLQDLIEAGQAASTSSFIQAVSVLQITDCALREELAELAGNQPYVATAAEFLVFCADLNRNQVRATEHSDQALEYDWTEQFLTATVDTALFAQNVVVAAESYGLGCCYIGGIRNNPEPVSRLLKLPQLVYPVFGLCIGYPAQNPQCKPRLPRTVVLHKNQYRSVHEQRELLDDYDTFVKQYYIERTKGKLDHSWSEQMAKQARTQKRQFMKKYLNKQGFMNR